MKETILKQLCGPASKWQEVFATIPMGLSHVLGNVVHKRVDRMQESSPAGRDNQCSWDTLYYNNRDIATNKPGMTNEVRIYCKTTGICLRKQQLNFLDVPSVPQNTSSLHDCCDAYKVHCSCNDCKKYCIM